jgi:hypothetical protein
MIRARYQSDTAVAGKHRRATDATNMSDDSASACRNSAPDQWVMTTFSPPGRHLFRWLRSAAFTTSGGAKFEARTGRHSHVEAACGSSRHQPTRTVGPLTLFLIDLAMGLCFNIIVIVTVVEILGAPL